MEGAPKRPVAATPPAHRGDTDGHPIALIVALQVPVRTQGTPPGRPHGRRRAAAYGPRVGGPDPADTPANGGSRRAAPPWRLTERMASGQRSTDPSGAGDQTAPGLQTPRSWAAACVTSFCSEVRHQDAPPSLRVDAIQPTTTGWATAPAPTMGPTKEPPRPWAQRGDLPSREDGRRREGPVSREKPADSRLHIYSPTSLGPSSCENAFWCPKVAGGEWFLPSADPPPEADSQLANLPRPPGHLAACTSPSLAPPRHPPGASGVPSPQLRGSLRACSPPPLTKTPAPTGQPRPSAAARGPPHPPPPGYLTLAPAASRPRPWGRSPRRGGLRDFRGAPHRTKTPGQLANPRAASSPPAAVPGDPRRPPGPLGPGPPPEPPAHHRPPGPGGAHPSTLRLRLRLRLRYGYRGVPRKATGPGRPSDRPPIDSPTSLGPSSCENAFRRPKVAGGERFLYGVARACPPIPYKSYFAIFAARPTGHGPSRRDAAKTLGQLARPGGGARPAWPSREAPPSQAPGQLAASSSGPRGPKSLDQLAGRDRHRRLALSSAPHPKTAGQLARSLARGSDPRGQGPGSETPLQAPGAAGPQQGYLTAYTTRLVTSVVCRGFIPARGDIAIRQPAPEGFSPGAVASLLRFRARRPIRIQLRRAGLHRRVPARILT
ncbi:hypothetical protein HFD88_009478 [Aspergillus terreus]|nr:hypothetical protein HFD88_009478 [Aspergillus terreus]